MSNDTNSPEGRDYRETLFLPTTDFPMRAGLPKAEPKWLEKWDSENLYEALREDAKGRPEFMLHDGPPYANGHLHLGHALNKILKDLVVRTKQMTGFDADYIPGWDCHGLPIEWKVEEQFRQKGKAKRDVDPSDFRVACREYAQKWVGIQRDEFKRLGVIGDWDNPYLTMDYGSEATIVEEFLKVAMSGQMRRGSKPVMWSPVEQTALAEAEVEYHDRKANVIWVKFPWAGVNIGDGPKLDTDLRNDLKNASVVIWTTTPWTIPANRAISYNPNIEYGLYECVSLEEDLPFTPWVAPGDRLVLAEKLAESVFKAAKAAEWKKVREIDPFALIACRHPLEKANLGGYDFSVPLIAGDHVTDDAGTGFVHTAPSHGEDDYNVWLANGYSTSDIPETLDDFGCYTKECPGFEGLDVIRIDGKKRGQDGKANKAVMDKLIEAGNLLARGMTTLRDAHSWRSKAPVIRRATPQWFIPMDKADENGKTLRDKAMAAIAETQFTPERGRARLVSMVEGRPDWLISRQRAWGVPLTLFVNKETGEILNDSDVNDRVVAAVEQGGADAWFVTDAADFLGDKYNAEEYEKIVDILDVWFDSGTTHSFTLEKRGKKWPADLYLEGSDQHRGWFQSSLLESCATRGRAPYEGILTHGFTLADDGTKMSKSSGNGIEPEEISKSVGAEIIRIWVASSDCTDDPTYGKEVQAANVESYRKLRNTLRYLLGALHGFEDNERVAVEDMPSLEQWMLHRLTEVDAKIRAAFDAYDFQAAFKELQVFTNNDVSAVYFDIRKDALYCDAPDDIRRRACRTVMDELFKCLTAWYAPIMVFTCEEAWRLRFPEAGSVHLRQFPEVPEAWKNAAVAEKWAKLFKVRRVVLGALEIERREKRIGSSLEAAPEVYVSDANLLAAFDGENAADIFITSDVVLKSDAAPENAFTMEEVEGVGVVPALAEGVKCARSWKIFDPATAMPDFPGITPRDAKAVMAWEKLNKSA
ncbi:isoleucine--tRNA ligase [Hirschia maritima]|uniref:isoleucine--tRNA ligase n=1 Tax=Hirschia maritima TaxID=1121961 RepID=UPI0003799EBC|nr:isoleucine--tRNA ligase [Hirschia maritima]